MHSMFEWNASNSAICHVFLMNVLKYSKNGSILLNHFVEHKPLISEEWKNGTFEILCQLTIYLYILERVSHMKYARNLLLDKKGLRSVML